MSNKLKKYIAEQPQIPSGFRYKTPIIVFDSKGFTVRNACQDSEFPLESWCISGAKTSKLVDSIEHIIPKAIKRHYHIIIYLWPGTFDFTIKEGKFIRLRHQSSKTVNTILREYERAIHVVEQHPGAEINFVDCPILSISKYNKFNGHKQPASFTVDDFQVTKQIQKLNSEIIDLNHKLNKNTIKVSKFFIRGRKIKRGGYRKSINISINKRDGLHPGNLLNLAITKQLLLDTYSECYNEIQESEFVQLQVEEADLSTLF
ncbi:unnamed protein product [Mytilus coruscus]|uniref:Uncharacterized protein n=1 Tax=Mytilus coruscus TaxID=42192 RepID=A0A6J7ZWU3_MYTCO|nr:unnamed protein product [Mytilus coruscus]